MREGFKVIFLHRVDSLSPFHQHFTPLDLLSRLEIDQSSGALQFKYDEKNIKLYKEYNEFKDNLLMIDYFSVTDYLYLLIEICQFLNYRKDSLVFLAAAVSDFYLPFDETAEHKIQSNQLDSLELSLKPVPKLIRYLKTTVCPDVFIVSFKLETDENLLIKKAQESLKSCGHDLVISNSLSRRKDQVIFVEKSMKTEEVCRADDGNWIEEAIVRKVIEKFDSK